MTRIGGKQSNIRIDRMYKSDKQHNYYFYGAKLG